MYKKAIMVIVAGIAIFYGAAMLKFVLSQKAATLPIVNIPPVPPTPENPPAILTPNNTEPPPVGRPRIDVVFALDSTGSMGDEIEVVKENIRNIISEISQAQPAPDVRYGIVTYRDRGDQYVTKSWQFTRDVQAISNTLRMIVADGGGDKPEAVNEALYVSLHKMDWDVQAKSKMVFLIGDAGPHDYPDGYNWASEVAYAKKQNIKINTIACSGIEAGEENVFNLISGRSEGLFAHLTYKQEYARADGSRAVVIEEAGRAFEVSKEAEKDWSRGASELIARNEAKALSSGATIDGGIETGVVGGVVGGVVASADTPMMSSELAASAADPIAISILMNRA
jgi:uncharacterized protein YegL